MAVLPRPWRDLHDAKNDLTAAKLLLHSSRAGTPIDVQQIESLIMQASSKIDELAFDDPAVRHPPVLAPRPVPEPLRQVYERQAALFEGSAQIMTSQAELVAREIELATLLAAQKRDQAALTDWLPARVRLEREAVAFEREVSVLRKELDVLEAQRRRALAQAETTRQKIRTGL